MTLSDFEEYSEETAEEIAAHLISNGVTIQQWIPVTEQMPKERESIFAKMIGTPGERPGMFKTVSDKVLVTIVYEDGHKVVETMSTMDGKWRLNNIPGAKKVTHWMPFPKPPVTSIPK